MSNYTLAQLEEMGPEQLQEIATALKIKKINTNDLEAVRYQILDRQAEEASLNAPAETNRPKARRGRPRKADTQPQLPLDVPADETTSSSEGETAKKAQTRGRRAKAKSENTAPASSIPDDTATAAEPPKRKRGRPRKNPLPEEAAAPNADKKEKEGKTETAIAEPAQAQAITVPDTSSLLKAIMETTPKKEIPKGKGTQLEDDKTEPKAETKLPAPEKAVAEQQGIKTPALDEFFSAAPRTFKPRSQREREENPLPAPVLPPPPAPGQGKKAKKQAQQQQQRKMHPYDFADLIEAQGVLEVMTDGTGMLRSSDFNYMPSPDDILVPRDFIKRYGLKMGDVVECAVRPPQDQDKYHVLTSIKEVNGRQPDMMRDRVAFEHLTPLFPDEKFDLCSGSTCNLSTRVVDMFSPIGKGQRGLIVAPPKTGKTILLKDIANAIAENHPETYIMILLIDERPEEVTDMSRSVNAEVIASTFDEPADRHVRIAGMVLEKAKRMVESGHDVVILLDSITRLARAYNTVAPGSGKILSGGVDANALQKPKRFFGAARNIEGGGSLTIIATALTETSSKMDEVIFEEFKGTGNMELQLDRRLSNKRIFPAVDITASSTRRDDLLLRPETLNRMWIMRRFLSDRNSIEAMEFIKERMERTRDNDELLRSMGD